MVRKLKTCSKCKATKPESEFYSSTTSADGRYPSCKSCKRDTVRSRDEGDADRVHAMDRASWAARQRGEGARAMFPEVGSPAWKLRLRWARCVSQASQHAKKFGAKVNDFKLADWLDLVEQYGGKCAYCSIEGDLQIEHVVPISRGGDNTKSNIVPACGPCNRSKSRKPVDAHIAQQCARGHAMAGDNVYIFPDGKKRICKTCRLESFRRYRAKSRPNKRDPQPRPAW